MQGGESDENATRIKRQQYEQKRRDKIAQGFHSLREFLENELALGPIDSNTQALVEAERALRILSSFVNTVLAQSNSLPPTNDPYQLSLSFSARYIHSVLGQVPQQRNRSPSGSQVMPAPPMMPPGQVFGYIPPTIPFATLIPSQNLPHIQNPLSQSIPTPSASATQRNGSSLSDLDDSGVRKIADALTELGSDTSSSSSPNGSGSNSSPQPSSNEATGSTQSKDTVNSMTPQSTSASVPHLNAIPHTLWPGALGLHPSPMFLPQVYHSASMAALVPPTSLNPGDIGKFPLPTFHSMFMPSPPIAAPASPLKLQQVQGDTSSDIERPTKRIKLEHNKEEAS